MTVWLAAGCGGTRHGTDDGTRGGTGGDGAGTGTGGGGGSGGSGGSSGASSPGIPLEDFARAYAAAECDWLARCGIRLFFSEKLPALCVGNTMELIEDSTTMPLRRAVAAGRATYDPLVMAECVRAPPCSELLDCSRAFQGTQAEGAACEDDVECAPGLDCVAASPSADACAPSVCTRRPVAGEPCSEIGPYCAQGLQCLTHDGVLTCMAQVPEGAPCDDDNGLICKTDLSCIEGVCSGRRTVVGPGERCEEAGVSCDAGAICGLSAEGAGMVGKRCFAYAEPGGECATGLLFDSCPPDEICLATLAELQAGVTGQRCTPVLLPGQACDPAGSTLQCGLFAHCGASGTCESKGSAGKPCDEEEDCYGSCNLTSGACEVVSACP